MLGMCSTEFQLSLTLLLCCYCLKNYFRCCVLEGCTCVRGYVYVLRVCICVGEYVHVLGVYTYTCAGVYVEGYVYVLIYIYMYWGVCTCVGEYVHVLGYVHVLRRFFGLVFCFFVTAESRGHQIPWS